MDKYEDISSLELNNMIENREKFKAYKHKNFTFKLVSGLIAESISDSDVDNMSEDMLSEL